MLFAIVGLVFISMLSLIIFNNIRKNGEKRILIIVLGDIGRSPRMQYHASSFIKERYKVDIIGFYITPLIKELLDETHVKVWPLNEPPVKPGWLPRIFYYIFKTLFLSIYLFITVLAKTGKHSHVLVQNPPAIPTLFVAWLICFFRQSKLIIDWHNYGYSILALTAGSGHPLVRFSQLYEHFVGQFASQNICVTEAMRNDLQKRWGICATTLYDRPPQRFQSISLSERHQMFTKLSKSYECFKSVEGKLISSTRFTTQEDNEVMLLPNRPALLISSTSWTEDEDFGLLLDALKQYDLIAKEQQSSNLPKLVCAITGKGPMKDHYKCIIMQTTFDYVEICTPWLEAEDYPILVGCADLGICLHTSSSGLDLPMKVVDMFGCGVPVCAVGFSCLNELVKHGENGLVFDNAEQLTKQLQELLNGFPTAHGLLEKFQENVKEFQKKRWHSCWKQMFHDPVFKNNS